MLKLIFINKRGAELDLSHNQLFALAHVDGMTDADAELSSIMRVGADGDKVTNARTLPRRMVFDLCIRSGVNVEDAKRTVLSIVKHQQECTLKWTQNGRSLVIHGVVDSVHMPRFSNDVIMQFSIHCGCPYWEDIGPKVSEFNEIISLHYFTDIENDMLYFEGEGITFGEYDFTQTRTVLNEGDAAVGVIMEITAVDTVTNPVINTSEGVYFGVGYTEKPLVMSAGDTLLINTIPGSETVKLNGTLQLHKLKPGSTFFRLPAGESEISVKSDDENTGNLIFTLQYTQQYI